MKTEILKTKKGRSTVKINSNDPKIGTLRVSIPQGSGLIKGDLMCWIKLEDGLMLVPADDCLLNDNMHVKTLPADK